MSNTCSAPIRRRDERDLSWFFGVGAASFQRSTFGAMLDRAQMFAFDSELCDQCDGTTFVEDNATCPKCKGTGIRPRKRRRKRRILKAECRKCAGTGLNSEGKLCGTCRGFEGLTAMPQPSAHEEPSYSPEDETLHRYAEMSRRLERLPVACVRVLAAYFGDPGAKWDRRPQGRVCALYPLTRSGRRLLEAALALGEPGAQQADDEAIVAVATAVKRTRGVELSLAQQQLQGNPSSNGGSGLA